MTTKLLSVSLAAIFFTTQGCGSGKDQGQQKAPRPVSVLTLTESDPGRFDRVTASVASWKTDEIGFEVSGRVQFVIEPERDVTGRVRNEKDNIVTPGDALARIDPTRYLLNVESAKAQVRTAKSQRDVAQIELDSVLPAEEAAATAERDLAQTEVERNRQLIAQDAAPQRALDLSNAKLASATAKLQQLAATKEAKRAEVASLEALVENYEQSRLEAERDVEDCELFSSFPGQVAEVHMISGSFAERGQPVVTIQMMDPIKVEFEVAPLTARNLDYQDQVRIYIPQGDGTQRLALGFIYMIDPVADPQTRTFTVTLLLRNQKVHSKVPDELQGKSLPRANLISKVLQGILTDPDVIYVNQDAILSDAAGHFLWKIVNREIGQLGSQTSQVLQVQKIRVTPGERRITLLGLATLRDIQIAEGESLDTEKDLIVGRLSPPASDSAPLEGDIVLYDRERWLLRPGDLVGVDLRGGESPPGIYVPLDAIMEKSGTKYVFVVQESPEGDTAKVVEVTLHERVGTLQRIEAAGDATLAAGSKIVAAGAAFLVDGEAINVSEEIELRK